MPKLSTPPKPKGRAYLRGSPQLRDALCSCEMGSPPFVISDGAEDIQRLLSVARAKVSIMDV